MKNGTLLFGASGFLGAHVLRELSRRGAPFACAGRKAIGGVSFHECDVRDAGRLDELLSGVKPARVVNCAALSRVADCEADPLAAVEVNARFPGLLAEWCCEHEARLVHVSTDLVFAGEAPEAGYHESDLAQPVGEYGSSKLAGEVAVRAADPRALTVRLPLLFGDSSGRGLGASDSLLAAIRRDERPALFEDEWRTPLAVGDAAAALLELAAGEYAGTLHVAGAERLTRFELGEVVLSAFGLPLELVRASSRVAAGLAETRARDVSLDMRAAEDLLECPLRGPRAFFAKD